MNNKCIFTYITGKYDRLINPSTVTPGWDYICFTDNSMLTSDIWDIRPIKPEDAEIECPKRRANAILTQYNKYIPRSYDICMIIDGNITINTNLNEFIDKSGFSTEKYDMLIPKHPDRNCIYDEATAILKLKKDNAVNINSHVSKLNKAGYPRQQGLHATSLFVLNNKSEKISKLFNVWHDVYFALSSKRDQMSFDYALWILENKGTKINICPCNFFYNTGNDVLGVYDVIFKRERHIKR